MSNRRCAGGRNASQQNRCFDADPDPADGGRDQLELALFLRSLCTGISRQRCMSTVVLRFGFWKELSSLSE